MLSTNIEDYKNCIFLINEFYPNCNNNPYDEFNYKIPSEDNSLNSLDTSNTSSDINEEEEEKYIPSDLFDLSKMTDIMIQETEITLSYGRKTKENVFRAFLGEYR